MFYFQFDVVVDNISRGFLWCLLYKVFLKLLYSQRH